MAPPVFTEIPHESERVSKPERDTRESWWITDLNRYQQLAVDQDSTQNPSFQMQSIRLPVCLYYLSIPHSSIHLSASFPPTYHLSIHTSIISMQAYYPPIIYYLLPTYYLSPLSSMTIPL